MDEMIERMHRVQRVPHKMELDLRRLLRIKNYAVGDTVGGVEMEGYLVFIQEGFMVEARYRKQDLENYFFIQEGDFYRHSTEFLKDTQDINTLVTVMEPVMMYVLRKPEVTHLLHKYYGGFDAYFREGIDATLNRALRRVKMLTKDPEVRLRYMMRRFPGFMGRVPKEDIAVCLDMKVEELERLKGWDNSKDNGVSLYKRLSGIE